MRLHASICALFLYAVGGVGSERQFVSWYFVVIISPRMNCARLDVSSCAAPTMPYSAR